MNGNIVLRGRGLVSGIVEGEALVSKESLVWSHGVDPQTGNIDDVRVSVCGECVRDKILIYPLGKGSTSGATWMLEAVRCGNGPKAIVNCETELIIVAGAVLSGAIYGREIPVVDRLSPEPLQVIETGDWVRVDGLKGIVEVVKKRRNTDVCDV